MNWMHRSRLSEMLYSLNKRLINSFRRIVNDNDYDGLCVIWQFVTPTQPVTISSLIRIVKNSKHVACNLKGNEMAISTVRLASTCIFISLFFFAFTHTSALRFELNGIPNGKAIPNSAIPNVNATSNEPAAVFARDFVVEMTTFHKYKHSPSYNH